MVMSSETSEVVGQVVEVAEAQPGGANEWLSATVGGLAAAYSRQRHQLVPTAATASAVIPDCEPRPPNPWKDRHAGGGLAVAVRAVHLPHETQRWLRLRPPRLDTEVARGEVSAPLKFGGAPDEVTHLVVAFTQAGLTDDEAGGLDAEAVVGPVGTEAIGDAAVGPRHDADPVDGSVGLDSFGVRCVVHVHDCTHEDERVKAADTKNRTAGRFSSRGHVRLDKASSVSTVVDMAKETLGDKVRRLRLEAGIESADALDRAAGLGRGHTNKIERGERGSRLSVETILKLTAALGCDIGDLVDTSTGPEAA